jgi:hypothetical protein
MDERHEQAKQQSKWKRDQRHTNGNGCPLQDVREEAAHYD